MAGKEDFDYPGKNATVSWNGPLCIHIGECGDDNATSGGLLQIKAIKNGPLVLQGNVTLKGGAGCKSWQGKQVTLCRCGSSRNKPFCDGQHKVVGFTSE